jgi:hypothetical protein
MPCANILIHQSAYYRKHVYKAGFEACGYSTIEQMQYRPKEGDVLLIWNRNKNREAIAKRYEEAGAIVLVTENGYIGKTKALAIGHHSGAGKWYQGQEDRWKALDVELKPWREDGEHILVLPQRSIGEEGVAMPRGWETKIEQHLRKVTRRPIRTRKHPGKDKSAPPTLEDDLSGCWAAVTWGSGAGVKSIISGVPVFHQLKNWIGASAATTEMNIENPWMGDRMPMLRRLAWAQWTWDEIKSGEAIRYTLKGEADGD